MGSSADESMKQRRDALKEVYVGSSLMFWTYVVTLGVFPVLCFVTGTGLSPVHNFSGVTLVYNIGDLGGKFGTFVLPMTKDRQAPPRPCSSQTSLSHMLLPL